MADSSKDTTHFGYQEVPRAEKEDRVRAVFDSVTEQYDLMNDLMSFGLHRWWKSWTVFTSQVRPGDVVLDLAGGTGDLTAKFAERVGLEGAVFISDINYMMLDRGRDRLLDNGLFTNRNIHVVQANAEFLPFQSRYFNSVSIGFGLRNVTNQQTALDEMYRVLKPGGQLLVLEFSTPTSDLLKTIYDRFSFSVLPWLGEKIVGDRDSYQYLAESIRMHPPQEDLKMMMERSGFEICHYTNFIGGVVALHQGYRT